MNIHVLLIDPQFDFCDQPTSRLPVPGGTAAMDRVAAMIKRLAPKIADIHVTLDSHRIVDISHPVWFVDGNGKHPGPYTPISYADLASGRWTTTRPDMRERTLAYTKTLEAQGRFGHFTWPEHCLIGDDGHKVWGNVAEAIHGWERTRFAMADFVTKGSNPWTEHFSALRAEVPDSSDPSTGLNTGLIRTFDDADIILCAGLAESHCLRWSVEDVATNFPDPAHVSKLVLLTDGTAAVPDPAAVPGLFSKATEKFYRDMRALGMRTDTTSGFLA